MLDKTLSENPRPSPLSKRSPSRPRTNSAADANHPVSTFESLSINTQLTDHLGSRDTSPRLRVRRFSDKLVLPVSSVADEPDPSLFSPGSVRARTVGSTHETHHPSASDTAPLVAPVDPSSSSQPAPSPASKPLDIRLSSGKTVHTSDFIHAQHEQAAPSRTYLVNPHVEIVHDQQQQPTPLSNETARSKLLQSVYVNNANPSSPSLLDPLTNGTNSNPQANSPSSNCVLS